ncbi:serine/arginine repetitive matrix protein 1-like isoform X2 [Columba livia]|uniref:serine/arginine repetitive matrix protein 1-like isoform X2 n=1 Tax=Columba livia TaxID=8932 RepID=UPI0031BBBF34
MTGPRSSRPSLQQRQQRQRKQQRQQRQRKQCGASAGAMALAQRLLPLLLLWVALHARTAQAAPWRARGADGGGGPDQSSRLAVGLEPLGRPGRLPRAEYQAEGGKKPPEAPEFRKQILKKSQGGRDMDRKAVQKEAFPEGSSRSLPVPGGKLEGMRDTGRPVPPKPGEVHRSRVYEFFQTDSDATHKRRAGVSEVQGKADVSNSKEDELPLCPQDVRKSCMINTALTITLVPLGIAVAVMAFLFWRRRKAKKKQDRAFGAHQESRGRSPRRDRWDTGRDSWDAHPDSWDGEEDIHESWIQPREPPLPPPKPSRPRSPRPPSPVTPMRRDQHGGYWPQAEEDFERPASPRPPRPPRPPSPAMATPQRMTRESGFRPPSRQDFQRPPTPRSPQPPSRSPHPPSRSPHPPSRPPRPPSRPLHPPSQSPRPPSRSQLTMMQQDPRGGNRHPPPPRPPPPQPFGRG